MPTLIGRAQLTITDLNDGQDATSYWLVTSTSAINKSSSGTYNPSSITVTAKSQTGTAAPTNYAGRFVIAESTDGTNFIDKYTSSSNESTKTYTPSSGIKAVRVRLYMAGGTSTLLDEQTIPVVADGQTTYTWVKYADDANGNGMSDTPDGKRYVGMAFNKTTPTESTNPADYSWSPLYDNVQVGGRNLVRNSSGDYGSSGWMTINSGDSLAVDDGYGGHKAITRNITASGGGIYTPYADVISGVTYTLSFWVKTDKDATVGHLIKFRDSNGVESNPIAITTVNISANTWSRIIYTVTIPSGVVKMATTPRVQAGSFPIKLWVSQYKLELGNVATDWTPAPEDVASDIAAAQAAANAANALLGDLSNDNKLTATEKQIVKTQWDAIVAEKPIYDAQADAYGLATQKMAYDNAYNTLNAYLTPLLANLTTTSDINGATFRSNFNTYYSARVTLTQAIYNAIKSGIDNGVKQGQLYNGTSITPAEGFKAVRSDGLVQTIMNATAGIKIQNRANTSQAWQDVFYVDTNGVLTAKGINVVGGVITGSEFHSTGPNGTVSIATDTIFLEFKSGVVNNYTEINSDYALIHGEDDTITFDAELHPDSLSLSRYSKTDSSSKSAMFDTDGFTFFRGSGQYSMTVSDLTKQWYIYAPSGVSVNGKLQSGNVYMNGANSIFNDNNSLFLNGKGGALIDIGSDDTGARILSMTIYNRTYSNNSNLYITPNGVIGRITSARRYKADIQEVDLSNGYAERILQLKPKSWFDKREIAENGGSTEGLDRIHGLIAEDVVEAGLPEYAIFTPPDENGNREVDGIAYDRLWTLLIPVVRDLKERIEALEQKMGA